MKNNNIKDIYGLTPMQEGIYAQYFRNPETKTYRLQSICRISRAADLGMLGKSVELLSVRHEVLKTAFTALKSTGAIKQVILENRKPEFRIREKNEPFSQNLLDEIVAEEDKRSFDLQRDSLFRVIIIDFSDERFMLTFSHHIIIDGWCLPVIISDLQKYYGKLVAGISAESLTDEIRKEVSSNTSYADYVGWLKSCDKNAVSEYWKNLLSDSTVSHIFGKEKKDNSKNEEIVTFLTPLDEVVSRNIERFAKENRISLNTVFESAFSIALQKYSGSEEVVFDKVISGRSIPLRNIDKTVGLFINTVPVRISADEETTLADTVKEIQKQTAYTDINGILPLADVYKAGSIDSKMIDALFVFENYYTGDGTEITDGALALEVVSFKEQTEFNLTVTVLKDSNGYAVRTSYAKEMYTEREITEFIRGYISILEVSLEADRKIKDISVTDTALLDSFNETAHNYDIPEASTLFSLFEKTARANSGKVCIKAGCKEVTFGEFLGISEMLDAEIRKISDGRKSVVAVISERSVEMYAAVYGIIRGGNAYLPIDPDYPQERIDYILENSNAAAVVAQGKFISKAGDRPCIDMTEFIKNAETVNSVIPYCAAEENDTAYVIYTSGSTGAPKGARVSHKSAVNRILWMHDKYPLYENGVILQKTPYTFDVSVWELFWWGMCGGCLSASAPGEHFLPVKILEETEKNSVTHLHFVPSVFEIFLNYLERHREEIYKFETVKYVFLSGEALSANLVQRFYNLYDCSKVSLHNLYGPTECAVDVTYYDCAPTDADPVPIGKPIYNTHMHILDKYLNPVPAGVTGELCIAGANVGQGYLNNPELTAEKFIDNPFGEGKLYRTGDLAYWREDGNIIFCGRIDAQIKLNGQRIELGEIESVISGIDGVSSVAVTVKNVSEKDVLVAFYTGEMTDVFRIKEICADKLPRYMIPNIFVHLEKLPLNQSGKLDRKALSLVEIGAVQKEEYAAPLNDTERFICDTFEKVLGIEGVGRNSDFFELGGTSISMISLLGEEGFEEVSAAEFISNPTPAMLSYVIGSKKRVTLEYLEPLHISDDAERVMILLPFAGGGAEAYSNFVYCMKKSQKDIDIYFVPFLHSLKDCKKVAEEIATALNDKKIYMYSHCVGSALALQILKALAEECVEVNHYFAGASIPPAIAVKKNIWNIVPDSAICAILKKAGADLGKLQSDRAGKLIDAFRNDTDFANTAFAEFECRINTPLSVIISKKDIFTTNYRNTEKCWLKYFTQVKSVSFIESESHYFQSDNAQTLTEIILRLI